MPVVASVSITAISLRRTRSIGALEGNREESCGKKIATGKIGQNVSHQRARGCEARRAAAQGRLGRYAGAAPDRQENGRRRSRGRMDRAQARRAARETSSSQLR